MPHRMLSIAATLCLLAGCPAPADDDDHGPQDDDSAAGDDDTADGDDDDTVADDDDDTAPPGPCPAGMELVEHDALRFCMDRWEAACDEVLAGAGPGEAEVLRAFILSAGRPDRDQDVVRARGGGQQSGVCRRSGGRTT